MNKTVWKEAMKLRHQNLFLENIQVTNTWLLKEVNTVWFASSKIKYILEIKVPKSSVSSIPGVVSRSGSILRFPKGISV